MAAKAAPEAPETTVDAFHRGRFFLVQPKGRGHRAGVDAMLLASLVPGDTTGKLADFGAGSGAAGMAVASRNDAMDVVLIERSPQMVQLARKSVLLPQNAGFAGRVTVLSADVTLTGRERLAAGLEDVSFDHVIMNPPFNDVNDRATPDALKAQAHAMTDQLFERWIRTASAVCRPSGQLSLIARPQSLLEILHACRNRFGGLQAIPVHPRPDEDAIRILLTGIKGSRARLTFRPPLFVHEAGKQAFSSKVDDLNNGRATISRNSNSLDRLRL
ncbi:tRNA1(Val) (adenine(37)-N6)-methyltransferase [Hoeflea poritis]|uniref:Methyltransferase n=1 Tax=Hoeflea poritis TaxID=2993659 RepID=A0ABT4VJN7_9HYPH|nr:methyltransferase [Hoeflea poritis]MDA4844870.1 methyltransferase [Hoeflea poritis]